LPKRNLLWLLDRGSILGVSPKTNRKINNIFIGVDTATWCLHKHYHKILLEKCYTFDPTCRLFDLQLLDREAFLFGS
jgi:hypothetical protein